jgi:hypothetical protein
MKEHFRRYLLLFVTLSLLVSGCSIFNAPTAITPATPALADTAQITCLPALTGLDKLADRHAGTLHDQRIQHTPWLRSNRFLASFNAMQLNTPQLTALLRRMQESAETGLQAEITQIPAGALKHWQHTYHIKSSARAFVKNCSAPLVDAQLQHAGQTRSWLTRLTVKDSYSTLQRVAGLYPVAAIPFRSGVVREQQSLREDWGKISGKSWTGYAPAGRPAALITTAKDALGIPRLSERQAQQLLQQHAPTWLMTSRSAANLPGSPYLQQGQLQVNTQKPVTYATISFGRWKNQITTQLNYLIWFKERPPLSTPDWVAGQHDAVIFRIHLNNAQHILAYDSIHLCGCWYRLFLPETANYRAKPSLSTEPVLAATVPAAGRMNVYLSRDTHHITYLQPATITPPTPPSAKTQVYQLQPFEQLTRLPVFNTLGYVPGSGRPERWLFWPMGVRNPGALRRFGEHAISFIGRRHFDDPYLLEDIGMY